MKEMMTAKRRVLLASLAILISLCLSDGLILAQEEASQTTRDMGTKLRRGASNLAFGWAEIPAGIEEIGNQHGVGAAATLGILHGTGKAIQRTAIGVFEILTFPFSFSGNFEPIIQPEYVLGNEA